MLKIYNSPIYSVQDGTSSFLYNVCGGRQPVNFTLQSQQCQISAIDSDGLYARLRLNTNIIPYLQNLIAAGFAAQIYVVDNEAGLYDYTGGYIVSNMIEVNGVAFLTIKNSDNDDQTFFVNKIFGGNWNSQVIYKYNTVLSLQYIDTTSINGNSANSLITTQKTALNLNGINTINISELCRGYIPQTGGKRIRVNITATDYFNNSEMTITPDVLLVDTRNLDVNYDNFTMFNPTSRGQLLPSTGQTLIYSATENTIYPFYINFVTNSSLGEYMPQFFFCIKAYKHNVLKATVNVNLIVVQGLNVINISNDNVIKKLILENEPDLISIKTVGYLYTVGDFSADFNGNDFVVSAVVSSLESDLSYISCTEKTLNDRKDFLLYFDNSIGGQSSILCNDFTRTIKPEITALRNRTNISNFVSRETEEVKLKFYGLSITDFEFLTGYNINSAKKRDGIFESQTIKRVTSAGDEQLYIIRAADYDADNSQLYTDLTLTIYRTIIQN